MRIAIATENREVCQHFGHCPEYTIYTIEDKEIRNTEVIPNPGHRPNFLPGYLHQLGIDVIIAGGMGPKAQKLFEEAGIDAILGVAGSTEQAAEQYVEGVLQAGASTCEHGNNLHELCADD
ncbi:MAG: NifB/NifX family molybdenum-iron cluster-binding protein [Halobacteriota archaeon]